ncbi:5111_t:CDS:1, partial [Funneliformis geosporum]
EGNLDEIKRHDTIPKGFTQDDVHFEECLVGRDLERSHKNRSLMSK